jgi:hypothetical protein
MRVGHQESHAAGLDVRQDVPHRRGQVEVGREESRTKSAEGCAEQVKERVSDALLGTPYEHKVYSSELQSPFQRKKV